MKKIFKDINDELGEKITQIFYRHMPTFESTKENNNGDNKEVQKEISMLVDKVAEWITEKFKSTLEQVVEYFQKVKDYVFQTVKHIISQFYN